MRGPLKSAAPQKPVLGVRHVDTAQRGGLSRVHHQPVERVGVAPVHVHSAVAAGVHAARPARHLVVVVDVERAVDRPVLVGQYGVLVLLLLEQRRRRDEVVAPAAAERLGAAVEAHAGKVDEQTVPDLSN